MKKILSLLALVLMSCMGAWAGSWSDQNQYPKVSGWNGKVIRMKAKWSDATRPLIVSNGVVKTAVNEEDEAALFALVSNPCYDGSFNMCLASAGVSKGIQWKTANLGTSIRPVVFQQSPNYNNTTYFWHCANLTEAPTGGYSHGCYAFNNQNASFNWFTKDGQANGYDYVYNQSVQRIGEYTTDFIVEEVVGYSAWKVIVDGNGTVTTSVTTTAQGNNGIVVVEGAVSESSFICSNGFAVTSIDSENKVVTIGQPKSPAALTSGWYQIKWVDVNNDSAAGMVTNDIAGKFVKNYATDVEVGGSKYPFYLDTANGVPATLDEAAKSYIYVDRASASVNTVAHIRSVNGHYAAINGQANVEPQNLYIIYFSSSNYPNNSVVCSSAITSDKTRTSWAPYETDGVKYIRSGNQNKYSMVQFLPVNLENVGMIPYTVTIINGATDAQVTYTGSDNYGLKSVYNNGVFFFASNKTLENSSFSAPAFEGEQATISINSQNHTITVEYGVRINVTYTAGNHSWSSSVLSSKDKELTASDVAVDFYKNFNITTANKTVSESNKTFDVTCDEDFPFTTGVATRIQSRGQNHQNMDFYNGETYPQYAASGFGTNTNLWVFEHVANTADFFTVKNVATGKYLTFQDGTRKQGVLSDDIVSNGANTSCFRIRKSSYTSAPAGAFCLQHPTVVACCYGPHINDTGYGDPTSNGLGGWAAGSEVDALKNDQNCLIALAPTLYSANLAATDGTDHYGSIYLPYTMTLPTDVEAYTAVRDGEVLTLTMVGETGYVIPAGAYILYSASETSATLALGADATVSAGDNALTGKFEANVALPTGSNYVLNDKNSVVGFYKYTKATYPVAKAVFCAGESSSNAFTFRFEDVVTAIDALHSNNSNAEIFDLQGRRLTKAQKGMNIINGHKVLVK